MSLIALEALDGVISYGLNLAGALNPYLIVGYEQVIPREVSDEILSTLISHHLSHVSAAGMEAAGFYIAGCIGNCDLSSLCLYDPDVRDLHATDRFHINQCLAFFQKRPDIDLGIDKELAAVSKFRDAERACALTNATFRAWEQGRFQFAPAVERVLHTAQRKISQVLGVAPAFDQLRPKFGAGGTTQVQKRNACLATKLEQVPACSPNLAPFAGELLSLLGWGDGQTEYEVDVPIHLCKLEFVPKNVKTYRSIMVQPQLNSLYQAAVGEEIAHRIKKVGLDIHDQSKNQNWAWIGSLTGLAATLDLSSASDTIASRLVQHLLPTDWYELLEKFRCSEAIYEGKLLWLEQFSSMGNGFTFPLETLIFWALSSSVVDVHDAHSLIPVTVYGDDIIVPTGSAIPLARVLRDLGFTLNTSKSFWYGEFRESCGCDYVNGINVRPCFLSDAPSGASFFKLHNFYVERGDFIAAGFLESIIHPSIRLRGPAGFGDGHLHSLVWVSKTEGCKKGWSGFSFKTWASRPSLLKKTIREHFGYYNEKTHVFEWKARFRFHVQRIATYVAYQAERPGETQGSADEVVDARKRDDLSSFVTPGVSSVSRLKIGRAHV